MWFVDLFRDDYIHIGRRVARPLGIAWWAIRTAQVLGVCALVWILWVGLWAVAG